MECNIYLHTEVKINGEWHHYGTPDVSRNYHLFARMAGVRSDGEVKPIAPPRGIPDDATALTKFDRAHWGVDGHSHSWLGAEEITELTKYIAEVIKLRDGLGMSLWDCDNFGYFFGNTWGGFWECRNDPNSGTPKGVEDIRFVFWFDN